MKIRQGLKDDYENVRRMVEMGQIYHVNLRPDIYKEVGHNTFISRTYYEQLVNDNHIAIAEINGIGVGFIIYIDMIKENEFMKRHHILFIDSLVVDEKYWNQGIAKMLIDWAISYAEEKELEKVELQVNANNIVAKHMYDNLGFTEKSINMEMLL